MRKSAFTLLSASAVALAACSGADDTAAPMADETTAAPAGDVAAETGMSSDAVLDPNTATAEQLAAIEGMTPELADAVVAGRPYDSATAFNTALMESLGEEEAATVRESVFVPINLNDASREDIALIPGMTDRMIGEFLEYRPYEDMAEFDREIGKYVDEAEVARFRRYVTL